jgi:ubiquinol-cytochrome c reductase cytochrome b subunit
MVFLLFFAVVIFFMPEMGGYFLEHPNFDPADPLKTPPPHRAGVVFHAVLRHVARGVRGHQVWGVLVMIGAIVILFFLPWLDRSPVKSIRYRGSCSSSYSPGGLHGIVFDSGLSGCPADQSGPHHHWRKPAPSFISPSSSCCRSLPAFEKTKPVPERVTWK